MPASAPTSSLHDLTFPLNKMSRLGEVQWPQAGGMWPDPDPGHVLCDPDSVVFSN